MKYLIIPAIVFLMVSCSDDSTDSETTANDQTSDSTLLENDSTNISQEETIPDAPKIVFHQYDNKNYKNIGHEMMLTDNIGGIMIGQEMNEVLMILGKASNVSPEEFWEVDGEFHTFWNYESLGLTVEFSRFEEYKGSTVVVISLDKNQLSTAKGVTVGTHRNVILNKYLNEISVEGNEIIPEHIMIGDAGFGGLQFTFDNDTVTNVYLGPIIRC